MIQKKMAAAVLCLVLSCATGETAEIAQEIDEKISVAENSEKTVSLSLAESIDLALSTDERIDGAEASRESAKWGLSAARRATGLNFGWNSRAVKIGGNDYDSAKQAHELYGNPHRVSNISVAGYVNGDLNEPVLSLQSGTVGAYAMNNTFSNSWALTVPIYTGGQLEGRIDASRYQLNQADLTLENTRQQVRYDAAEAYANLLHRRNLERVAEESVKMAEKQLRLINDQYVEGAVARADVLLMEVRLANYRQNLMTAKTAVKNAMSVLASLVGISQDTKIFPADIFTYEPYKKNLSECEEYALLHRPDGLAADYAVKVAEAQKDVANAGYRPKVSGTVERNISGNSPFRKERNSNWSAGVSISWSLFDNGVTEANVRQADSAIDTSVATATRIKKNIRLETRTAFFNMKSAEENLKLAAAAVKQAEKSHEIAQVRYEEGVDILLTVADAQERLTQARSNYFTALYQYNLYRATLEKAMGVPVEFDPALYVEAENNGESASNARKKAAVIENEAEKFVDKPFSTKENDNETEKKESPNEKFSFAAK